MEFQIESEGTCQQVHVQNSSPTPLAKASAPFPADGSESPLSRPSALHKQPPALPPKPFNRLPTHITGMIFSAFAALRVCDHVSPSITSSLSRRRHPCEVAVHVQQAVSSSTSEEAPDLSSCRERGALSSCLPEVPRPTQPRRDGRTLAAVRGAAGIAAPPQQDHRGTQQDACSHHAEV